MDKKIMISPHIEIRDAITALIVGKKRVTFVVDENKKLLGLFTNGDMRKYFLTGKNLTDPVSQAMNANPIAFKSINEVLRYQRENSLSVYPVVDDKGILINAIYENRQEVFVKNSNLLKGIPLIIMAGGKGTRLWPITKIIPKALVPIGELTITERVIESFNSYGCNSVFLILNYKSNMIKSYFNDLKRDYSLEYLVEDEFYGTGGGLYLLKKLLKGTFILSNCDVLINEDISTAYKKHLECKNHITIVCSMHSFSIPYGIIKTKNTGEILEIKEKPKYNNLVNTGVYFIEKKVLDLIEDKEYIDMPDIINRAMSKGYKVGVFPISDSSWFDMGEPEKCKDMSRWFE